MTDIISLFNASIQHPKSGANYPLIFNSLDPQFYFVDIDYKNFEMKPGYELVGTFTINEINNPKQLQNKIDSLKKKWCDL